MGYFSSNISDFALACPKSSEAPFETSNLSSDIKRSVEGLLRRETYLCAIASGAGLQPLRAQSTIPILDPTPNPFDPKSAKCTTSIKVVTC